MADRIDDIVDRGAVSKQLNDTTAELSTLNGALKDTLQTALQVNQALGQSQTLPQLRQNAEKAALAQEKLAAAQAKTAQAQERLTQLQARSAQQEEVNAARLQRIQQQRDNSEAQADRQRNTYDQNQARRSRAEEERLARQQRAAEQAARPFTELTQRLREAENQAADLGVTFGTNSVQFQQATANVQRLRTQVDAIEQPLGRFQRNVGNYASGIAGYASKVFGFLRTAANIIPGLGLSGIFLLIFTGLEKVYNLIGSGTSLLELTNKLNSKANDLYAEQASKVTLLVKELQSSNVTAERRAEILDELNKVAPTYFGNLKNESDILGKLPDAYKRYNAALLENSRIEAAKSLITEEYKKQLEAQSAIEENRRKLLEAQNKRVNGTLADEESENGSELFIEAYRKIANYFNGKDVKNAQQNIDNLTNLVLRSQKKIQTLGGSPNGNGKAILDANLKEQLEFQKNLVDRSAKANGEVVDNEKLSYSKRRAALKDLLKDQQSSIKIGEQQQLIDSTLTNDQRLSITSQTTTRLLEANQNYQSKLTALNDSATKDRVDRLNSGIEKEKAAAQRVYENENVNYSDRFAALAKYIAKSKELINQSADIQIKDAGENADKIKTINNNRSKELNGLVVERASIEKKIQDEINKKYAESLKQRYDNLTEAEKQQVREIQDAANQRLLVISDETKAQKEELIKRASDGKLTTEQYNQELFKIEQSAAAKRSEVQVAAARKVVESQAAALAFGIGSAEDLQKSTDALAKLEIDADNLKTARILENLKKRDEAIKSLHDREKQIATESIELIKTIVDGGYQRQLDALTAQGDAITANADKEKDAVDRSLLSDEEKANKKKLIDARAQAQSDSIAKQQKKIKQDQAEFDRAIAIAQIIQATAVAEIQALSYLGNILTAPLYPAIAATIAALGAVQLATILATPIPQYKDGVRNKSQGSWSIFGEAGTEYVKEPGKQGYLTEGPTVGWLPAGTDVISNRELMAAMANPGKTNYVSNQLDLSALLSQNERNTDKITKALEVKQDANYKRGLRDGKRFNEYLKRNIN